MAGQEEPSARKKKSWSLEAMIEPSYGLGLLGCIVYLKFKNSLLRIYPSAPGLTIRAEGRSMAARSAYLPILLGIYFLFRPIGLFVLMVFVQRDDSDTGMVGQ